MWGGWKWGSISLTNMLLSTIVSICLDERTKMEKGDVAMKERRKGRGCERRTKRKSDTLECSEQRFIIIKCV